ncbi:hypothetical protein [Xenorhabdus eapokensis]|nr:hypothetical protein [Xenorhabdus eapokensis]
MTNEFENARRKVARDCLEELTALPKYDDNNEQEAKEIAIEANI